MSKPLRQKCLNKFIRVLKQHVEECMANHNFQIFVR